MNKNVGKRGDGHGTLDNKSGLRKAMRPHTRNYKTWRLEQAGWSTVIPVSMIMMGTPLASDLLRDIG